MMRTLPKLLLFIFLLSSLRISAQVLAGGEIYYELVSAKKYLVTAHLYRLCDQAPLNNTLYGNVYSGATVAPMSLKRTAISKINDTCGNPCNQQNAVSNPGFERHTFVDTVDFNSNLFNVFPNNNLCIVNFGVRVGGRTSQLTTVNSGVFYLDASTNICLSNITKNTSPQFSMEPKFIAACNLPMTYSPGPLDTMDNDSFDFSLVDVQSNYNTSVTYKSLFSSQYPMTPFCIPSGAVNCKALPGAKPPRGFYLDKLNGTVVFTPNNCAEIGVIKYKINEYRFNKKLQKHEWLGFVTREMGIQIVKLANNNPPSITPTSNLSVCEGNKVCLTIKTADVQTSSQSVADSTTLYWDKGIKNATFIIKDPTAREKEGEFCWQTKKVNTRIEDYFFTVATFDKQCNVDLASRTFNVKVNTTHNYTYKNTIGKCGLVKWDISSFDSLYPNYKCTATTVIRSFNTNNVFYTGNGLTDSTNIHVDGKIIVEHTFNTNCPVLVRDTFTISGTLTTPDVNDNANAIVCKNAVVPLSFKASRVTNLKDFKWYLNDTLMNQNDTTASYTILRNSTIKLWIENTSGCSAERIINYTLKQHNAISSTNQTFCPGTIISVNSYNKTLARPVNYQWKINGIDTLANDSDLVFKLKKDSKIILTLTDANGCVFTDSATESVWPAVDFNLQHKIVCKDSAASVKAANLSAVKPFVYSWEIDKKAVINNDSILPLKATRNMEIILTITDKNNCSLKNTIYVQPVNTPEVNLDSVLNVCYGVPVQVVPFIANKPPVINYLWTLNKAIISTDSVLNRSFTSFQLIRLKVSNQLNCSTQDEINVNVFSLPVFTILHDTYYYPDSFIIVGTTGLFKSYQWFNGATTAKDSFNANTLGTPGKHKIWCKVIDFNGCETTDTVEIFTNKQLSGVHKNYLQAMKVYPNPVSGILNMEMLEMGDVYLFSVDGRLMGSYAFQKGNNQIDMTMLSKGVYYIKCKMNDNDEVIFKIVKE